MSDSDPPPRSRLTVGLTGGLAAGKSTVGQMLAARGCAVFDGDRLVAELYRPGEPGARAVRELFGEEALAEDGSVDRSRLAAKVFRDETARRRLECAVHPLVKRRFEELAASAEGIVVLEAPVLVEAGWEDAFDVVVTVEAPDPVELERAVARGMDRADAERRLAAQSEERRRRTADVVVENDADLATLERRVDDLVHGLRARLRRVR